MSVSKWLVGSPQLTRDWGETGGGLRVEQGRDWSGRFNPMTPRPIPFHYLEPRSMRLVVKYAYFTTRNKHVARRITRMHTRSGSYCIVFTDFAKNKGI